MTQQQALQWLNGGWRGSPYARNNSAAGGLGIDFDGKDGFQCKDFANAYGAYMGAPLPTGNAIVLAQQISPGWSWQSNPQPGDLAVRNYVSSGINYGDVVGVLAVNGNSLTTIGQNQINSSLTIGHVPTIGINPISAFIKNKFVRYNYQQEEIMSQWTNGATYNLLFFAVSPAVAEQAKAAGYVGFFGAQNGQESNSAFNEIITSEQFSEMIAASHAGDTPANFQPYSGPQLFTKS